MNLVELKKQLKIGEKPNIYLFVGEEIYIKEQATELIKNSYISEPSLNYATFDGENYDENELLSSVSAYPFLSEYRLTVVKEFYPKADFLKKIIELADSNDNCILLILNSKKNDVLSKSKTVKVFECKKEDTSSLIKIITEEFKKDNLEIDYKNAKLLAEYCLNDSIRILNEIEKIKCYLGSGKKVTEDTILLLVSRETDYEIYELTNYIGKKNYDEALFVVKELLSRGETPQRIITNLYYYMRKVLYVIISDKSDSETAKLLGYKDDYPVKKIKEQARLFRVRAVKNAVDNLCEIDYKIKRGEIEVNQAMWKTLFSIIIGS